MLCLAKGPSLLVDLTVMVALTAGVVSQTTAANDSNFTPDTSSEQLS